MLVNGPFMITYVFQRPRANLLAISFPAEVVELVQTRTALHYAQYFTFVDIVILTLFGSNQFGQVGVSKHPHC